MHQVGGSEDTTGEDSSSYDEIFLRTHLVSVRLPDRAYQRSRKPLSKCGGSQIDSTLPPGSQEEYVMLPTHKWVRGIHELNIADHIEKDA